MSKDTTTIRGAISSINVVEPTPKLRIALSRNQSDGPTIDVDGVSTSVAMSIPWGDIIDAAAAIWKKIQGPDGGNKGCTKVTITNADNSTTTVIHCPAPS